MQLTGVAMHRTHGPPRPLKCAQIASNGPKGVTQQHNPETRRFWVRFVWYKWGRLRRRREVSINGSSLSSHIEGTCNIWLQGQVQLTTRNLVSSWDVKKKKKKGYRVAEDCPRSTQRRCSCVAEWEPCVSVSVGQYWASLLRLFGSLSDSVTNFSSFFLWQWQMSAVLCGCHPHSVTAGYKSSHLADSPDLFRIQTGTLPVTGLVTKRLPRQTERQSRVQVRART